MALKPPKFDPKQGKITDYTSKDVNNDSEAEDLSMMGRLRRRWNLRHGGAGNTDGGKQESKGEETADPSKGSGDKVQSKLGGAESVRKDDNASTGEGYVNNAADPAVQAGTKTKSNRSATGGNPAHPAASAPSVSTLSTPMNHDPALTEKL